MTSPRCLVLVTGAGRSGTSTIAGTLAMSGVHVPGPWFAADESNPKGYYESTWSVRWHKKLTRAAGIHEYDSRPAALERVRSVLSDEWREELVEWLRRQVRDHDQVLVKDPRTVWTQRIWQDAAAEAGMRTCFLSMIRHPAEVVGSRTTYYADRTDEASRRRYEIFNVARWVNVSLISEHETRGQVRTFVRYTELLDDWRSVVERVADDLGLTLSGVAESSATGEIDAFIDPALRRHAQSWGDLGVPAALAGIAEEVWQELTLLARPGQAERGEALDALRLRYTQLLDEAAAIAHDSSEEVRRETAEAVSSAMRQAGDDTSTTGDLDQVRSLVLVRELGRRAAGRLQPSRR